MDIHIIKEDGKDDTDSVFIYIPNFLDLEEQKLFLSWLNSLDNFKENLNFDKSKVIRLQRWYQMEGKYFCPKWEKRYERWMSHKYDELLLQLQKKVQDGLEELDLKKYQITVPIINSCLINKYRSGKDRIRPHRDTEQSFGKEPTIIGLSLGCPRYIRFRRVKYDSTNKHLSKLDKVSQDLNFDKKLESGSLFMMAGSSQKFWTHEIPESGDDDRCNPVRFSLTFREFISD